MGTRMLYAVVLLMFVSCGPSIAPNRPNQTETSCAEAEKRLLELGCPQAKTPAGAPFKAACEHALSEGRNWHPECIARITACEDMPRAYRGDCQ